LLTSAQPEGLRQLRDRLLRDDTKSGKANISTIERIEAYETKNRVPAGVRRLKRLVSYGLNTIKFRLFNHRDDRLNAALMRAFLQRLRELNLPEPELLNYGPGLQIFRLSEIRPEVVDDLANFVGTQSLSEFTAFRIVKQISTLTEGMDFTFLGPPEVGREYPVVGLIDTGTHPDDSILSPWRVDRANYVVPDEEDFTHGSFIAGLVAFGRELNQGDIRFPNIATKFVDVAALPKKDRFTEDHALAVIEEVLVKYSAVRVWNLSFGSRIPCKDNVFSDYAAALDDLQDRYNVMFTLAAGNYQVPPLRGWPAESLGETDRICGPGDSVRGITVGSLANAAEVGTSRVGEEEPSPFSRRGPGPAFVPKPELVHYGGNCDSDGRFTGTGLLSLDGQGNLAESIGTSFSSPIVAGLLATVQSGQRWLRFVGPNLLELSSNDFLLLSLH